VASLRQDARHLVWLLAGLLAPGAWAATVRVENPAGRTTVHAVMGAEKVDVRVLPRGRAVRPDDVKRTEQPDLLLLQCRPADGAVIDLEITLPHTSSLEVVTQSGTISLDGLIRDADLTTGSGDVELTMPWELMRISVISGTVPKDFFAPKIDGLEFLAQPLSPYWTLRDRPTSRNSPAVPMRRQAPRVWRTGSEGRLELIADTRSFTYGEIRVTAKSIGRLDLAGARLPADSWVKPPKLAAAALEAIAGKPSGEPAAAAAPKPEPAAAQGDMPLFVSQVRMVNLAVSVVDREGHPAQGLQPEDFEVLENGVPQKISVARPEDVPFNLVLLLDLSGSTVQDRPAMMEAAKRFVQLARPGDRAAIYIMEQDLLDNVIALSLVQESLHSSEDRSALVVITDGRENMPREPDALVGSAVSFEALRDAVAKSPVLLYPILLHASDSFMNSNREKMQQLAQASGGRSFSAESIRDLDPVYPLVAEELRSVYGVTYYPENQDFDGRWRRLEVRLKRPGFTLRTREGYYAR
jgi:hypothetical protein